MFGFATVAAILKSNRESSEAEFWDSTEAGKREGIDVDLWRRLPPSPNEEVIVPVKINGVSGTASVRIGDLPPGYHGQVIVIDDE